MTLVKSISVSPQWIAKGVEDILKRWEADDKRELSNKVCEAVYNQYQRDSIQEHLKKNNSAHFITDKELNDIIERLPDGWTLFNEIDFIAISKSSLLKEKKEYNLFEE